MLKIVATDQAEVQPERAGEEYARAVLMQQLQDSADMTIIANAINSVERRRDELPLCRLQDRDFKDFRRIVQQARGIVRGVHADVQAEAIEAVAVRLCESDGYAKFHENAVSVQNRYRRMAQSAVNCYHSILEHVQ